MYNYLDISIFTLRPNFSLFRICESKYSYIEMALLHLSLQIVKKTCAGFMCGALLDLVPSVQFKKREKHP